MANPQKENGYTAIANEIMEALAHYRIPGEQRQVLDVIIRKTYGFNKKMDRISNSQFVSSTGLKKPAVCRAISALVGKNVIKKDNRYIPTYQFNKNYKTWKVLSKKITVIKKDIRVLSKKIPTKDTSTKEKTFLSDSQEIVLSELLFSLMRENNPKVKEPNFQTWGKSIGLMIRRDNRTPAEIRTIIEWCQQDDFWQNNILSTSKLRKQFDQLWLKMHKAGNKPEKSNQPRSQLFKGPTP